MFEEDGLGSYTNSVLRSTGLAHISLAEEGNGSSHQMDLYDLTRESKHKAVYPIKEVKKCNEGSRAKFGYQKENWNRKEHEIVALGRSVVSHVKVDLDYSRLDLQLSYPYSSSSLAVALLEILLEFVVLISDDR